MPFPAPLRCRAGSGVTNPVHPGPAQKENQFLDPPKKTGDFDGGVAEATDKPADRPAVRAYRRKASCTMRRGGHPKTLRWPPHQSSSLSGSGGPSRPHLRIVE
jgi:hypothetical protein